MSLLFDRSWSKRAASQMVMEISRAFEASVSALDWMDDDTRERARRKLGQMAYWVGYPEVWKQYDFPVAADNYGSNVLAARAFETRRDLTKVGKPVDRNDWQMSPPTVNAYYDPQLNQMVFPAGILQPPFYAVGASIPVNAGAIGMVVGHELTHGFDDEGAQFDGKGNLDNWWAPQTAARFAHKTQCVADQFGRFEALPGLRINGPLTLGENIADMGGLKLAFRAYRTLRQGAPETTLADGFTEDQQFFLALGQLWCTNMREPYLRLMVQTNPHSPPRFRVNGSAANMPEFAEAFECPLGSPMNPKSRCAVW
jgi:putative endopeptidase